MDLDSFPWAQLLILAASALILWATFYGLYRAYVSRQAGWAVAIVAAWIVGLGWLVGLVFLLTVDRRARRTAPTA
jgi:hypothetical protein